MSTQLDAAPNVFLNVSGGTIGHWEYVVVAIIGVTLQLGVLIFDGVIYLHPSKKLHSVGPKYAFPFTVVGTLGVMLGTFLCAYVVEASTVEETWEANLSDTCSLQTVWLQRGQIVGDQTFRSFAIYDKSNDRVIRTSRKALNLKRLEFWTLLGTALTVVSFVFQFIGLRGMHWSASVGQLLATAIMVIMKALIRRNLSALPRTEELAEGYELDIMAKKINQCKDWRILPAHTSERPHSEKANEDISTFAARILATRVRLSEISKWPIQSAETVDQLVLTLQATMDHIFKAKGNIILKKGYSQISEFDWIIPVAVKRGIVYEEGQLKVLLKRIKVDGKWTSWLVDKEEVSALFSLWMSHFTEFSATVPEPNLWIFGANTTFNRIIYDWWIYRGARSEGIKNISEYCAEVGVDEQRVFNMQTKQAGEKITNEQNGAGEVLGIVTRSSLQTICGQYLLGSFLRNVIQCIERFEGKTSTTSGSGPNHFTLFDDSVGGIAEVLQQSGFATVEDSYRILIPPLSDAGMLRDPFDILEDVVGISKAQADSDEIGLDAEDTYSRLIYLCERKAKTSIEQDRFGDAGRTFVQLIEAFSNALGSQDDATIRAQHAMRQFAAKFVGYDITLLTDKTERTRISEPFRLHAASARGDLHHVFESLLDYIGANQWNDEHDVPLGLAVKHGYLNVARLLIFYNAFVDQDLLYATIDKEGNGQYPNGSEMVKLLLLNLNDKTDLLLKASAEGYHIIMALMAQTGINITIKDNEGFMPLHIASRNGNHEVVKVLLEYKADPNAKATNGQTALHLAAENGHEKVAHVLVDAGSDLLVRDQDGQMPLHVAAFKGHVEIVQFLIERGSDLNGRQKDGRAAIHLAALADQAEVVKELISHEQVDQNARDKDQLTALHFAAKSKFKAIVLLLSENRDNLLIKDKYGRDPLIMSVDMDNGDESIVSIEIERGSDLNTLEDSGRGALEYAALHGLDGVVEMLIDNGAPLTNKDGFGRTALHYACMKGYVTTTRILLKKKFPIDEADKDGWTALHYANRPGHLEVINTLVAAGANTLAKDRLGKTPDFYLLDGGESNHWSRMLPTNPFWTGGP